jgi:hypothetical protein
VGPVEATPEAGVQSTSNYAKRGLLQFDEDR